MTSSPTPPLSEVTLVLASQRSGSSLLCRDIEAVGGLGRPREYFRDLLQRPGAGAATVHDILERVGQGATPDSPATGAVKLMLGQAPGIAAILRDGPKAPDTPAPQAVREVIGWMRGRFARVQVFAMVRRDTLDQAISLTMARMTGVWHIENGVQLPLARRPRPMTPWDRNTDILNNLLQAVRQRRALTALAEEMPDICRLVTYEDIAGSATDSRQAIVSHAARIGMTPGDGTPRRALSKIVRPEDRRALRHAFHAFLRDHGLDTVLREEAPQNPSD